MGPWDLGTLKPLKLQNIVQTMHLTMSIAHLYLTPREPVGPTLNLLGPVDLPLDPQDPIGPPLDHHCPLHLADLSSLVWSFFSSVSGFSSLYSSSPRSCQSWQRGGCGLSPFVQLLPKLCVDLGFEYFVSFASCFDRLV